MKAIFIDGETIVSIKTIIQYQPIIKLPLLGRVKANFDSKEVTMKRPPMLVLN